MLSSSKFWLHHQAETREEQHPQFAVLREVNLVKYTLYFERVLDILYIYMPGYLWGADFCLCMQSL